MIRSFYNAVSSMITMENKQNTIVNNMSNANTTGYKSQELETESFQDVLIQNRDKLAGTTNVPQTIGSLNLGTKVNTVVTKFTQGDLRATVSLKYPSPSSDRSVDKPVSINGPCVSFLNQFVVLTPVPFDESLS